MSQLIEFTFGSKMNLVILHFAFFVMINLLVGMTPSSSTNSSSFSGSGRPDIYVNLRLYYDDDLSAKFSHNKTRINNYLLGICQSASLYYNYKPLYLVGRWWFIIQTIELVDFKVYLDPTTREGNDYRIRLHEVYKSRLSGTIFATQVLFSGYNWRYSAPGDPGKGVDKKGLALGYHACLSGQNRAIIVEARSYMATVVLAHELGHALAGGGPHDEDAGCSSGFIMSKSVGFGKTAFSLCSYKCFRDRFNHLFAAANASSSTTQCFRYSTYPNPVAKLPTRDSSLPYFAVSSDQQCEVAFGGQFRARELRDRGNANECAHLECTNALVHMAAHPAIENTPCGNGHFCRAGRCRPPMPQAPENV